MKPNKRPKPKPKPAPVSPPGDALFRIELRQIYQIRLLRRIARSCAHGNPAESQAMKDQIQKLIDSSIEATRKLKDAVPPQKE